MESSPDATVPAETKLQEPRPQTKETAYARAGLEYLRENYPPKDPDNKETRGILGELWAAWQIAAAVGKDVSGPDGLNVLEIGGGGSIYQLIGSEEVDKITYTDVDPDMLALAKEWKDNPKNDYWDEYFKYVLRLKNSPTDEADLTRFKEQLRKRLAEFKTLDLYHPDGIKPAEIVSVHYVPESITDKQEEFDVLMENIFLLSSQGEY